VFTLITTDGSAPFSTASFACNDANGASLFNAGSC
jgi:hypothetical protein